MAQIFGEDITKDPNFAKFKTPADLAKSYKELQANLGKPKFDVPTADTPPEQTKEFWTKMGVPETAEAYGLKADANVPEHANETNVAFLKAFSENAKELNLTTAQAQGMQKFFDDLTVKMNETVATSQAEEDSQLDALFTKALGADKDVASQRIKADLEKVLPEEMKPLLINKISNEALTALAIMEKHYRTTYGQGDKNAGDGNNMDFSGKSVADLRKEGSELYGKMQKAGALDPGYAAMKAQYDGIYKTIDELTKAGNRK